MSIEHKLGYENVDVNIEYRLKLQYDKITIELQLKLWWNILQLVHKLFVAMCSIDFVKREGRIQVLVNRKLMKMFGNSVNVQSKLFNLTLFYGFPAFPSDYVERRIFRPSQAETCSRYRLDQ
jgi:hypothetical protein